MSTIEETVTSADLLGQLRRAPVHTAIGACLAFLLEQTQKAAPQLRAALNATVMPGRITVLYRIIDVLVRAAQ